MISIPTFQMLLALLMLALGTANALPDITPHEGAIFSEHGFLIGGLSWAHITAPINISRLENDLKDYNKLIDYYDYLSQPIPGSRGQMSEEERKRMLTLKRVCLKRLARMKTVITDLRADLGVEFKTEIKTTKSTRTDAAQSDSPDPVVRQRRQAVVGLAAIGGMIVGAIAGSLFSQFKTAALVDILNNKVDTVVHQVDNLSLEVYQDHTDIARVNTTLDHFETMIGKLLVTDEVYEHYFAGIYSTILLEEQADRFALAQTAIDQLLLGKLHKGLISPNGLTKAIEDLRKRAENIGMLIGVKRPIELYQLHTSFAYDPETDTLHVIIHVPMYREKHMLSLKRYVPIPFFSPGLNKFLVIEPKETYLAHNADVTVIKTLAEPDLSDCLNIGHAYFCEDHSLQKATIPTCLLQMSKGIKKDELNMCPVQILPQIAKIHQTSKDSYVIATSVPTTIIQSCWRNQDLYQKIEPGTYQLKVDPNCTTSSDQWVIYPTVQINDANINTTTVQYDFDIPTLHDHLDDEDLKIIHALIGTIGKPVPLEQMTQLVQFRKDIKRENAQFSFAHLLLNSGTSTVTVITIVVITIIGYMIYRSCSQKRSGHSRLRNDYEMTPMMSHEQNRQPPIVMQQTIPAAPATIPVLAATAASGTGNPVVPQSPTATTSTSQQLMPPQTQFTFLLPKGDGSLSS